MFFLWMDGVLSCVTAPKLQEDWIGTKDEIGSSNVHFQSKTRSGATVNIPVTAPELQEDWLGTKDDQHKFMSISEFLNLNCKRRPSTSLCELRCI